MKKKIFAGILAIVTVFGLTACGKEIDKAVTKSTKVEGTYNLWWFCDGTTLIYWEDNPSGDDEYEAFFSWGCTEDGKPTKELPGVLGDDGNGTEGK